MQKTLALIFGGEGAERRISEISAANVIDKIKDKIDFITVGISDSEAGLFSKESLKK